MKSEKRKNLRLFINSTLQTGAQIELNEDASHYLCNVMRLGDQDEFSCFDGCNGEFAAKIISAHKKHTLIRILNLLRPFQASPDIWLLYAPLKKDATDFVIAKAVELGASRIIPVITARTNAASIRTERLNAQAVEAAEQCERLDVPPVEEPQNFAALVNGWDKKRTLYFMDETHRGCPVAEAFAAAAQKPAALLVGPEGGFSPSEIDLLYHQEFARGVSLGPRILRAETAVAASLAVWQALAGDWEK